MKKILITLTVSLISISIFSQSYVKKQSYVRKHFNEIENNLNTYSEKSYTYQPDEESPSQEFYYFWFDKAGHLVKAQKKMDVHGYYDEENFYFFDGKLIFYFWNSIGLTSSDGLMIQYEIEERVYFYNQEIFEYFTKNSNAGDDKDISEIKNTRVEWTVEMQEDIIKRAVDITDLSTKSK